MTKKRRRPPASPSLPQLPNNPTNPNISLSVSGHALLLLWVSEFMVMEKSMSAHRREDSAGSDREWGGSKRETFESFGWVFHLGVNSIGKEYCHLRFLFIRGNYVEMYKRDPNENPGVKPIRRGIIGPSLMVEELGHRKVNHRDVYALRFYNRLDERQKGQIACATAEEAQKWIEAFDHAKQQAEMELTRSGSARYKLTPEAEINLGGHRPKMRRMAKKLIRIGQGPETLMKQPSNSNWNDGQEGYFGGDSGDVIECHDWRCIRTINGIRIFEDAADAKNARGVLVKSVAVVDASAETVFNVVLSLEKHQRHEWDTFADSLELVDTYEGHYDVVYGTIHPKYLSSRWQTKRDFVISRQWFHAQDGTYTILLRPSVHRSKPPRSGYRRTNVNSSTWEIRSINTPMGSNTAKSLVTQVLETQADAWSRWKNSSCSKFEKTVPYALLSQVSGLKEYVEANPPLKSESTNTAGSVSTMKGDFSDVNNDQFYDAIGEDSSSSSDEEVGDEEQHDDEDELRLKNVSLGVAGLNIKKTSATDAHRELDPDADAVDIDLSKFNGSLAEGKEESDSDCWTSPCGTEFMIRGKNYLKDNSKVVGREPILKLIAVDWLKVDGRADNIALNPKCLVQSEAGKELPFILIINLQIPAKPNYSLVSYYAADRPLCNDSLLAKFADGTDAFRDSRFKLIPSIVQGYWMVKRAVGTKACMLGKAVTCRYLRQDNFLEIDVDIGSSSVARNVIGLVLGYVTSLVVDLAILVEAKEEEELPEYILGSVRLNRINPTSASHFEV